MPETVGYRRAGRHVTMLLDRWVFNGILKSSGRMDGHFIVEEADVLKLLDDLNLRSHFHAAGILDRMDDDRARAATGEKPLS